MFGKFFKVVVRGAKVAWGFPLVLTALLFTLLCMLVALFGGGLCAGVIHLLRLRVENLFAVVPRVWASGLRHVFFRWAGIAVFVQNDAEPFQPEERVLIGANHGSLISMLISAWGCVTLMPHPVRWVIKNELMQWWKVGPPLEMIGLAWPIDRTDRDGAIGTIATMGEGFARGSAVILIDGTRPTLRNIREGRCHYRHHDESANATRLQFTPRPRTAGFRTMITTIPHERVVRVLVTSSIHEEGLAGLLDLMWSGAVFLVIEDWIERLPADKKKFRRELNQVWLGRVQDWIWGKRAYWAAHKRYSDL